MFAKLREVFFKKKKKATKEKQRHESKQQGAHASPTTPSLTITWDFSFYLLLKNFLWASKDQGKVLKLWKFQ